MGVCGWKKWRGHEIQTSAGETEFARKNTHQKIKNISKVPKSAVFFNRQCGYKIYVYIYIFFFFWGGEYQKFVPPCTYHIRFFVVHKSQVGRLGIDEAVLLDGENIQGWNGICKTNAQKDSGLGIIVKFVFGWGKICGTLYVLGFWYFICENKLDVEKYGLVGLYRWLYQIFWMKPVVGGKTWQKSSGTGFKFASFSSLKEIYVSKRIQPQHSWDDSQRKS